LIAATIDKYVYLTLHETFDSDFIVKYSKMERVKHAREIKHVIIREALKLVGLNGKGLELASMADIPTGSGLGSSGSFTTALLRVLHSHKKNLVHPKELAEQACHIEIDILKEPIGKQDQYVAAYGGINCFSFHSNGSVDAKPVKMSTETLYNLEDNLLLFFTGYSRSASKVLKDQDEKSKRSDHTMIQNLHAIKKMAFRTLKTLEKGNMKQFADIMNEHWELKRKRSKEMSNDNIDKWYRLARKNGALGGKLIGAGGGGFLMFYVEDKTKIRRVMRRAGLREVRFHFDFDGAKVVSKS